MLRRVRDLVGLAERRDTRVYLVGGVVRDLLLGRALHDIDLVVEGDALALARDLERAGATIVSTHARFGTVSIRYPDVERLDLATARKEIYAHPAALPQVEPSSLEDDLRRRDFTINSMAVAVSHGRFGEVLDPTGGRADLAGRRIRVLHERSFLDDPTRALRAIRFAVRLRFSIVPDSSRLLRAAVDGGVFARLSGARLRRELELLFEAPGWGATARQLERQGLWAVLAGAPRPTRADVAGLQRLEGWVGRATGGEDGSRVQPWVVALAWLTRPLDDADRKRLVTRLAPDRHAARDLLGAGVSAERILAALRALRAPRPSAVHRACGASSPVAWLLALAHTREGKLRRALERYLDRDSRVRLDIGGEDLLRCGVAPGPRVALGLEAALAAKLDGRAAGRPGQLSAALRAARRP